VEKYGTDRLATDDDIIWRLRIACWITNDTDIHREYIIVFIAFPRQQWLRGSAMFLKCYFVRLVQS